MRIVRGDLLALALGGQFDVIIHGCNCHCAMGAGIAMAIKTQFPEAFDADQQTEPGARDKLGSISVATVDRNGHQITVVNAYTQFHWRGSGVLVDYEAIRSAMREVKARFSGNRIGYPKIGAGLAGGDWGVISAIIAEELGDEDHTLVEFAG